MLHVNSFELWTLTCQGVTVSAAQAGVGDLVRRCASQTTDTCQIKTPGRAVDAPPLFAVGSTVTVARGGVPWFVGRVTAVPASGDGQVEEQVHLLSGPWWYLEQLVCQQPWSLRGGTATGWISRLVLGLAADGTRLTTGEVIRETLQYAIDAGAPLQIGVIEPMATAPLDELRDVTCAEVIESLLRWHPDCVAWFDYTTAPVPTFHCRARSSLPATTLTLGQPPLESTQGLTARHDLQTPAVVLHYEVSAATGDGGGGDSAAEVFDVVTDTAPADATGREFGAVVGTIPLLRGGSVTTDGVDGIATAVEAMLAAVFPALHSSGTGGAGAGAGSGVSLASVYYQARAMLQYSGSVTLREAEAGGVGRGLGHVVNLAGSAQAGWTTMRAVVVEEEIEVAAGRTVWTLGPAKATGSANLRTALFATRSGVAGREAGSPALLGTTAATVRLSGRVGNLSGS